MEKTISNFVTTIDRQGFVDTTKYQVYINSLNGIMSDSHAMYCTNISIPGFSLNTIQKYDAGPIRNIPIEAQYPELQLQFYCSLDFNEYQYFQRWMTDIYGSQLAYKLPYYNEIIGNVMITTLDKQLNPVKDIVFYEAYPINLGDIAFAYENNPGEPAKFSVSLTYHHWEMINSADYISPFGNNWRGGADYYGRENRRDSTIKSAETPMSKFDLAVSAITGYNAEDNPTTNLGGNTP